jgi:Ca-activated chloride channel family protein
MKFEQSGILIFLIAIIPMMLFMLFHYGRKFPMLCRLLVPQQKKSTFQDRKKQKKIVLSAGQNNLRLRYIFSCFFFIMFYALIIIALAGPQWGTKTVLELRRGADIVLAFDVSRSMNVRDAPSIDGSAISASRLERSVWIAKKFIDSIHNANIPVNVRFGIALGKGSGVLAIPLTGDEDAIRTLLDGLSFATMTSRGTNLEKLLDAAGTAFQDSFPSSRSVILFSDGEALSGSLNSALERLRRDNATVYAVGSGSVYGAPLPASADIFQNDTANQNLRASGKSITSYLKADFLRQAVERNAGFYIDGNREEANLILSGAIMPTASNASWISKEESGSRWHIFVIAALASFAASGAFAVRQKTILADSAIKDYHKEQELL